MAICDFAVWAPPGYSSLGEFSSGPVKAVWHRTQGSTYAGAWSVYRAKRVCPHFTIDTNGVVYQHFDTSEASFSLANDPGGVQTNRDSALQVEVVGFSGETMPMRQRNSVLRLMAWFGGQGVPWRWPSGRPPRDSNSGYGKNTPHRNPTVWDTVGGHYGHSQVPENSHWDPAWTDEDWHYLKENTVALTEAEMQKLEAIHRDIRHVGSMIDSILSGNFRKPGFEGDLTWLVEKLKPLEERLARIEASR